MTLDANAQAVEFCVVRLAAQQAVVATFADHLLALAYLYLDDAWSSEVILVWVIN
jgi:hypothetical protein